MITIILHQNVEKRRQFSSKFNKRTKVFESLHGNRL